MHDCPIVYSNLESPMLYGSGISYVAEGYLGLFGCYMPTYPNYWTKCRESITAHLVSEYCKQKKQLYYYYCPERYGINVNKIKLNIARWFWYIEGHMGWTERTKVYDVDANEVGFVLSPKWFESSMNISLATLMVRIAPYCDEGVSIDYVLDKNEMSRSTKDVIWKILSGCGTCLARKNQLNWREYFLSASWNNVFRKQYCYVGGEDIAYVAYAVYQMSKNQQHISSKYWEQAIMAMSHHYQLYDTTLKPGTIHPVMFFVDGTYNLSEFFLSTVKKFLI